MITKKEFEVFHSFDSIDNINAYVLEHKTTAIYKLSTQWLRISTTSIMETGISKIVYFGILIHVLS